MKYTYLIAFICVAIVTQAKAKMSFNPSERIIYKTVGDAELKLDVFYPEGHKASDKSPAIVFFFGGGWIGGAPSHFHPQSAYLASRGMVAISAQYRTEKSHGTTPQECVKDGKSAIRWVRQHAAELGIDPDKIMAGGGSAGGHIAAATALIDGFEEEGEDLSISCRPVALVLYNPVIDNSPGAFRNDRVKEYWEAFSPMHNIDESAPPTVFFLGTKDGIIPVETAETYKRLMEEKGGRCDLHIYEGEKHGFFNYRHPENFKKTMLETDHFLVSLGYLEGEPTLETWLGQQESPAEQINEDDVTDPYEL